MKRGLSVVAALLAGALLAHLLLADPGYVALKFHRYLIEMSVPSFVLALIAIYFLIRVVARMINARRLMAHAQAERRRERARRNLARGLIELSEGNWSAAETTLTRSARDAESPVAHYLAAARASELLGATARRDEWLAKALDAAPEERTAVLITQAEMYLKHNQLKAALATLEQLEASGAQNSRGLSLLARIYRQQSDWRKLEQIEPRLRAAGDIPTTTMDEIVAQICLDRLKAAGTAADARQLAEVWKEAPKPLARRPDIVVAYARAAMACRQHDAAGKALRGLLSEQWDEGAVLAYGELEIGEPLETLETAERWLPDHSEDPALLLTCGRLCIRAELYGKARSYLETSLAIRPRLETYQVFAHLMEQLGERDHALKALNDALVHALGRRTNLPRVRALRMVERRHAPDRRRH